MKKKKGSVVIAGYYGFGNAGDELILGALIQDVRDHYSSAQITVLSAQPEQTAARFNVESVNRWQPWAWVAAFWNAETFILGGGGLLQETSGLANHTYYLSLIVLAKLFYCRTEIRAIGVDPIRQWFNRLITRFVLDTMTNFISVRDADSQRALEASGVHARIWRMPDPVFHTYLPKPQQVLRQTPVIGWALAPWGERPGWDLDLSVLLDRVAQELHVEHELMVFFPDQDEALAKKIAATAASKPVMRQWERPDDLVTAVQEYELVIGMRYHALVLASLAQKTFIGWGFQQKIRTLCRDFNQPMWTFERGWDGDAIFRQICDAWKRRASLPDRYKEPLSRQLTSSAVATETSHIFVAQV